MFYASIIRLYVLVPDKTASSASSDGGPAKVCRQSASSDTPVKVCRRSASGDAPVKVCRRRQPSFSITYSSDVGEGGHPWQFQVEMYDSGDSEVLSIQVCVIPALPRPAPPFPAALCCTLPYSLLLYITLYLYLTLRFPIKPVPVPVPSPIPSHPTPLYLIHFIQQVIVIMHRLFTIVNTGRLVFVQLH